MKILLIGNYTYLKSQSMDRFASLLFYGLKTRGHDVRLLKPPPLIGRLRPLPIGIGKWIGYIDRFVFFKPRFCNASNWADVVHICDQANAMYAQWLKGRPHVVTCHDMLAIRSAFGEIAEYRIRFTGKVYQRWILSGLSKAMHVTCVSSATRDDVLRLTKLPPEKISVVHNGLNYKYRPMAKEEFSRHLQQMSLDDWRPFFLHVGNNNCYKNKAGLLRIFSHMVRLDGIKAGNLVLAGTGLPETLVPLSRELGIYDRIREAINVTNEQLCALYSAAQGLIFPSLAEGFGWPIIEAQACGCPVFTSNRKPMTEVGGDSAVYFDTFDEVGTAKNILQELPKKDVWRNQGLKNAVKYSTESMLSVYLDTYKKVVH